MFTLGSTTWIRDASGVIGTIWLGSGQRSSSVIFRKNDGWRLQMLDRAGRRVHLSENWRTAGAACRKAVEIDCGLPDIILL